MEKIFVSTARLRHILARAHVQQLSRTTGSVGWPSVGLVMSYSVYGLRGRFAMCSSNVLTQVLSRRNYSSDFVWTIQILGKYILLGDAGAYAAYTAPVKFVLCWANRHIRRTWLKFKAGIQHDWDCLLPSGFGRCGGRSSFICITSLETMQTESCGANPFRVCRRIARCWPVHALHQMFSRLNFRIVMRTCLHAVPLSWWIFQIQASRGVDDLDALHDTHRNNFMNDNRVGSSLYLRLPHTENYLSEECNCCAKIPPERAAA